MTEPTRRLARAADIELKRRGVLGRDDILTSAEPEGFTYPEPGESSAGVWVQPRLDGSVELPRQAVPEPLAPAGRERRALEAPGLTPGHHQPELPLQITEIAACNHKRQTQIDQRRPIQIPAGEPGEIDLGQARNVLAEHRRDAVTRPPRPPIPAADTVVHRAIEREAG